MTTTSSEQRVYQRAYWIGLLFNVISFAIYLFGALGMQDLNFRSFLSGMFVMNFIFTFIYAVILLGYKLSYSSPRPNITQGCWVNLVMLFTISAFSLNQEMQVFARFPAWLNIYTLIMVAVFFAFPYARRFTKPFKILLYIFLGSVAVLSLYMTIFLCPLMPLSLLVFWFFGISLHSFVPALWLLLIILFLFPKNEDGKLRHFAWIGAFIPLCFLTVYLVKWNTIQTQIQDVISEKNVQLGNQLPDAIQLAQKLPSDPLSEQIMISPFKSQRFWGDDFNFNGAGEHKFHDPLSLVAIALLGEIHIDASTVETFLNIRRDYRHKTTRKLWMGNSLSTTSIASNIQVFPEYRLAYHEKTFVIHNSPEKNRDFWFSDETQEALYTFHVPEGSIVTSLSLWINGKEQKSRLSTVQKADSAYTQIVGVQRRDPAVVHWQEGNRITVNVFPCTTTEDRTFKIGFTTPLSVREGKLWLENIWFEGPDFNSARETTRILLEGGKAVLTDIPDDLEKNAQGNYEYSGDYRPYWEIPMQAVPLSTQQFRFNGNAYQLQELEHEPFKAELSTIYLDITNAWTKEEYDQIIAASTGKKVIAWLPERTEITAENKELVWEATHGNQFSMPFLYDISSPEKSLVLTKCGASSPILADLKDTDYSVKTTDYLQTQSSPVHLLNIGSELSPLWRSLVELKLVNYEAVPLRNAVTAIQSGKLNRVREDSMRVSLNESHLCLVKTPVADSSRGGTAPDHLLRMFAYNDILRRVGKNYFKKERYENVLFREAEEGYVVTPVTSMIVLESEADYKRMGIDENNNTVGNAGIISGGAVPEPHEWLLIGLVLSLILHHLYRNKKLSGSYFRK
jgi:XrtN system VIT domain protein